jgi:ribosome biogenesis GTPase
LASKKRKHQNPIEFNREKRSLNKAKRQYQRGKAERTPRRRDWESHDDAPIDDFERIMPRGESERRRHVEQAAQTIFDDATPSTVADDIAANGRVIEVTAGMCRVDVDGETLLCTLRGGLSSDNALDIIAVGDRVHVTELEAGRGRVEEVAPRHTQIARPDPSGNGRLQVLAANIDQLLIVQAWRNPNIWYELIDRYLITAERSGVTPIICVNKIDLTDDLPAIHAALAPYVALGYDVLFTSAAHGRGLAELHERLHGAVTAVAGLSGVGKSSLLGALLPGFELRTGEVNDERGQGRHTTTQATLLPFDGGYVIDTPGIRAFGLAGLTVHELDTYYPEIARVAAGCRFADCTHQHEPDCAVLEEVRTGGVSEIRYHSYSVIRAELSAT